MAKCDRTGKRKAREQRSTKKYELGYYLIVTDTEATEKCYFDGLNKSLPDAVKKKLRIETVPKIKTWNLVRKCQEELNLDSQYRKGWIVFDRDEVLDFDDIISHAEKQGISVGWSNPCFEIWLYTYFGEMPEFKESTDCCTRFGRKYREMTGCKYSKNDENLYLTMDKTGNEEIAIKITKHRYDDYIKQGIVQPSKMTSYSTVFKLVQEIIEKVRNCSPA